MTIRKYHTSAIQICGDCLGECLKELIIEEEDHYGHGGKSIEVACSTCSGSGMVKVSKDIIITVTPHPTKHPVSYE